MQDSVILAYDLGTSGAKCALVTPEGRLIASATSNYPLYTDGGPKCAEQDPEDYWSSVCIATKKVLAQSGISPDAIAGIGFGALWKGIIPIDAQGNVLRRSMIWMDGRAETQSQRLSQHFNGVYFGESNYWAKLLWLRENEPEVIEKAQWILEVSSYLKWKATGNVAVDRSNNFAHSFDPEQDTYYAELFTFMDIPREKFPPVVEAKDLVGTVTEQAARELGIVPGIPVFGSNNDMQSITVGSGCAALGDVHVYFGSSGWMGFTIPHGEPYPTSAFDAQRDIFVSGLHSVGLSLNWMARTLYAEEFRQMGDAVFSLIDKEVAQIPAGSGGVLAAPWFYGELPPQSDLNIGGSFLNLRQEHTRGHMARAVMEGICFQLKQRTQFFCPKRGYPWPKAVNAVGGGACSEVWMQILADVLNVPVRVPAHPRHAGAVGAAYSAIVGLGLVPDYTHAAKTMDFSHIYSPNSQTVGVYETSFQAYVQLYYALKPILSQLYSLR